MEDGEVLVPDGEARRGAGEDETLEELGAPGGNRHRDRGAHAAADEDERAQAERRRETHDEVGVRVGRGQALDAAGAPVAGKIERDDAVVESCGVDLSPPHAGVAARGVEEDEQAAAVEGGGDVG